MKKLLISVVLIIVAQLNIFAQSNYLMNDIANLIGLNCDIAKDRLEEIYHDSYGFYCDIEIIDDLIVFKPIIDEYSFLKISQYILCPTITFVNNNNIIKTIISNQIIEFNSTKFFEKNNITDESIINITGSVFASFDLYSKRMIENDEIFDMFVNRNANAVPLRQIEIEKEIGENYKLVKYIWKGNEELYEYIGRNDLKLIEYIFTFNNEYFQTTSSWYIYED